jgi:hypothetical protein
MCASRIEIQPDNFDSIDYPEICQPSIPVAHGSPAVFECHLPRVFDMDDLDSWSTISPPSSSW